MEPELVADTHCIVGEGPLWHPDERRLYWTDILGGRIHRFDPATGQSEVVYTGPPVGGFTLQADGSLLLFRERGAVAIWRDGQVTTLISELPDEVNSRFNDVIADPTGRVYCGTMPTPDRPGRLYLLDRNGEIRILLEGVTIANGMGFTPNRRQMYFTDTIKREIYRFDYHAQTGDLHGRQIFVRVEGGPAEGAPDGMTVDSAGNVWSARWGGSVLVRYSPNGDEVVRLSFPTSKVSCPTFGGDDYADLYVTTAAVDDGTANGPHAGGLFRARLEGVRGVPEFRSRVGL